MATVVATPFAMLLSLVAVAFVGGPAAQQACVSPPPGLVSWWPGDGSANDIVDANSGVLQNGATAGAAGKVGQAFSFDGLDDHVRIAHNTSLNIGTGFSVDAWFKADPVQLSPDGLWVLIDKSHSLGGPTGWVLQGVPAGIGPFPGNRFTVSGEVMFAIGTGATFVGVATTTNVRDGQFHHIAVTWDGSTISMYLDGVLKEAAAFSGPVASNNGSLFFGQWGVFGTRRYRGLLDEVETHSRALSPSEIQAIVLAGGGGKCKSPIAHAGPDQGVNEAAPVVLDGSGSKGLNLVFAWEQVAGPPVSLNGQSTAAPTFTAPLLPGGFGGQVLTFKLTVTGLGGSSSDTVDVFVSNVNHAPVADAGDPFSVKEDSFVALYGGDSYDPDGDPITFEWVQVGGLPVTLSGGDTATPSFTAPLLPGGIGSSMVLTFSVTVTDGGLRSSDVVEVVVEQMNHAPVADAGIPQTVHSGRLVMLDGSLSGDPDGDVITYRWTQTGGPPVDLADATTPTPSFTAPPVAGAATLMFALRVSDTELSSEAEVTVTVMNKSPLCHLGRAIPGILWPPDHRMVPVVVAGVTDPDDATVRITITGVTQDEPVNGLGDGDTSPDAVVGEGGRVLLRAERSGLHDGRVYVVRFTADDGQGGACAGSVAVAVPRSAKPGSVPGDDGQLYDSTQP